MSFHLEHFTSMPGSIEVTEKLSVAIFVTLDNFCHRLLYRSIKIKII